MASWWALSYLSLCRLHKRLRQLQHVLKLSIAKMISWICINHVLTSLVFILLPESTKKKIILCRCIDKMYLMYMAIIYVHFLRDNGHLQLERRLQILLLMRVTDYTLHTYYDKFVFVWDVDRFRFYNNCLCWFLICSYYHRLLFNVMSLVLFNKTFLPISPCFITPS